MSAHHATDPRARHHPQSADDDHRAGGQVRRQPDAAAPAVRPPEYCSAECGDAAQPRPHEVLLIDLPPFACVDSVRAALGDGTRARCKGRTCGTGTDAGIGVYFPDLHLVIGGHAITSFRWSSIPARLSTPAPRNL